MQIIPIVLDLRPGYLDGASAGESLLSLPLGTGSVFGELSSWLLHSGCTGLSVLPTFQPDVQYVERIQTVAPPNTRIVGADVLANLIHDHEPSDLLLVVDPRYWPLSGLEFGSLLTDDREPGWAVHGVAMASAGRGAKEYVHCDDSGRIRRISRYYDQVTHLQIKAVSYSVVPLASCEKIRLRSLAEFRAALAKRGVLSRDVPIQSAVVDLSDSAGFLTLSEQQILAHVCDRAPYGFVLQENGVLVADQHEIHESAKIIGPVIVQDGVCIEKDAIVVGPSVLGAASRISKGATVAQSVLACGAIVPAGHMIRQNIAVGIEGAGFQATLNREGRRDPWPVVQDDAIRLLADASAAGGVGHFQSDYPRFKLIADVALAGISLVLLAPLFAIVALLIKLDSRGPVFFGHQREGKDGDVFRCLKFRTMCADAHLQQRRLYNTNALDGPQFKLHNDPRVTRVGTWLRATNIDELPQLINVFLGQMSLVGPRPSPFRENQICVPWRRARLSVRPGITGLWQICRDQRSEGDFHQWIAYDILYVRNLSFWLDIKILVATALTLGGLWNVPPNWLVRQERGFPRQSPDGRTGQKKSPQTPSQRDGKLASVR